MPHVVGALQARALVAAAVQHGVGGAVEAHGAARAGRRAALRRAWLGVGLGVGVGVGLWLGLGSDPNPNPNPMTLTLTLTLTLSLITNPNPNHHPKSYYNAIV